MTGTAEGEAFDPTLEAVALVTIVALSAELRGDPTATEDKTVGVTAAAVLLGNGAGADVSTTEVGAAPVTSAEVVLFGNLGAVVVALMTLAVELLSMVELLK